MRLKGFYPPFTTTGKSALIGTPPWHFSGEFLVIDYQANPDAVAAMLPPGLEPDADAGACSVFFGDYQCCSEDRAEMEIPHLSQYKEAGITIAANYKGNRTNYCAYIWTTKDFLSISRNEVELAVMQSIKQTLDPQNLMNPHKLLG